MNLKVLIKKEYTEIIRSKRMLVLAILFLFIAISSPILAKLIPTIFKNISTGGIEIKIPDPTWRDAIDQFVKNINQIAGIVIVFMFAGSIAEEKSKKTLEMVLTKPVSRPLFILAKFLSGFTTLLAGFLICSAIFYLYTTSLFEPFSAVNFSWLTISLFVFLVTLLSITIFCSTIFANQLVAAGVAFFIDIVLYTILGLIEPIQKFLPGYVLSQYKMMVGTGMSFEYYPSIIASVILIVAFVVVSIVLFNKQSIES